MALAAPVFMKQTVAQYICV